MRNLWGVVFVFFCMGSIECVDAKSFSQIQDLYKKIGEDLVSLRKEYTPGQPKIYTILDRVDRMYNLTKGIHQKKKNLKKLTREHVNEVALLKEENKNLRSELFGVKEKIETTSKKLETVGKQLESEKYQALKLSQERGDLLSKVKQIEAEKNHLKSLDINDKVAKGVDAEVEEQLKNLKNGQSLTLSSTSAPSSPR